MHFANLDNENILLACFIIALGVWWTCNKVYSLHMAILCQYDVFYTYWNLISHTSYHNIQIEHLKQIGHANRGCDAYSPRHLILSKFGTIMCSNVETNLPQYCLVSGLWVSIILRYFYFTSLLHVSGIFCFVLYIHISWLISFEVYTSNSS